MVTGLSALALQGIGFAVVGVAPAYAFWLAVGAMFFTGFMNPIINGSMFAVLQATVPTEVQGRVFTLLLSGAGAMMPLGLAIAGPVSHVLGVQVWFVVGGIAMVALGIGAFFVPAIMPIEDKLFEGLSSYVNL